MTIKEAEGVSPEVAAFIGLEPGPLDDRLGEVCTSITDAVAADGALECLPKLEKFDPALWSVLRRSLSGLAGELASGRVSELLEMERLHKKRGWMKKHRREEAQAKRGHEENMARCRELVRGEGEAREKREKDELLQRALDSEERVREMREGHRRAERELQELREQMAMWEDGQALRADTEEELKTRLQQHEMLQQEGEKLRKLVASLLEENKVVRHRLEKERKSKEACRELVGQLSGPQQRPRRKCAQPPEPEEGPPMTAADARGFYKWPHDKVEKGVSKIAGHGLFSLCNVRGGQCVFTALLPDEPIESAFAVLEYSCYRHIIHKDGLTALAIDPGSKMRGNVWACKADNDIRLLRFLNHHKHPNVELIIDDAASRFGLSPLRVPIMGRGKPARSRR